MPDEGTDGLTVDTAAVVDFIQNNGEVADPTPDQTVDHAESAAPQDAQTPTPDPLGPDPDVSDLPPDVQALVNERVLQLRQGFTKRTTELADANRILEAAGGDPEAILEAYSFQQTLMEDGPEGDAARARLYQALSAQYGQQAVEEPSAPEATPDDPFAEYDLPPEIKDALSMVPQLKAQLDNINAAQEAQQQELARQQYIQEVYEDLSNKWQEITTEFPDVAEYEDAVFALGAHTNGNLLEAVDIVRGIEARAQAKLFQGSANVPGGQVAPPIGGGHSSEPPVEFTDFKSLRGPVTEWLERATQGDI